MVTLPKASGHAYRSEIIDAYRPREDRPDHIEDFLCYLHMGQWFGWKKGAEPRKQYANLVLTPIVCWNMERIANPITELPTEQECNDGLKALQDIWDLENASWKSARKSGYPTIQEQLDMQYHDKKDGTTTWVDAIQAIKDANPKS